MILIFWIKKYNHPEEYVMGEGGVGSGGGVGNCHLCSLARSPMTALVVCVKSHVKIS